ncbi:MAG: hypothetical protein MUF47_14590 [Porphyrobacter sp.]|nr:hypothetical protein [Porphyrobacter sp.]
MIGLVWVLAGHLPSGRNARLALAGGAVLALFLPLLIGPDVGGVQRWLPAGPVSLHAGTLLLPLIAVIAAQEARVGPALLAIAGAALALQPDAAALAGLAAAGAVLAGLHRSAAYALVAAAALALAAMTFTAGTLEPQLYTEGVLAHVAAQSLAGAAALGLLLFGPPLWYWAIRPVAAREECGALAAILITLGIMAIIAPFPYPLIGYGASPILGFALALGAARGRG